MSHKSTTVSHLTWNMLLLVFLTMTISMLAIFAFVFSSILIGFNFVGVVASASPLYENHLPEPAPTRTLPPEAAHYLMTEYPELYNQETMRSGR